MMFAYKCRLCGTRVESSSRSLTSCPNCLGSLGRDYSSVQFGRPAFRPHFNHAVGAYVESSQQFDDLLAHHSERNGSPITRVDPGDVPEPKRDTDILDAQARTIRDRNINPLSLVKEN
jgi:hypothetical protein